MKIGILWDLDGTLLDTLEDLMDGVNYALDQYGLAPRTLEEIRKFVGNGAANLINQAVDGRADEKAVLDTFRTYYNAHCQIKTGPYEGVMEALDDDEFSGGLLNLLDAAKGFVKVNAKTKWRKTRSAVVTT